MFIQIFLFSINGLWTMFKDKKMEKMMFATGRIYRETGMISQRERLPWRVKWGERGAAVFGGFGILMYVINSVVFDNLNIPLLVVILTSFVGGIVGLGMIYYKNFSFVIAQRLLKEVNVVMILVLGICIFTIDYAKPINEVSPVNGENTNS
jgi:hypothetical protein